MLIPGVQETRSSPRRARLAPSLAVVARSSALNVIVETILPVPRAKSERLGDP
jgi:hypothetical protein